VKCPGAWCDGGVSLAQDEERKRPAGRRLAETREFFAFVQADLPDMIRRWQEHKAARGL